MELPGIQRKRQVDLEEQLVGGRLAGEQLALARVVLGEDDYLVGSFQSERASETTTARSLEGDEAFRFLNFWKSMPLACIRSMNRGIGHLTDAARIHRYTEAAVDLEILMDRTLGPGSPTGEATPVYLPDGYRCAKNIGVDKEQIRSRLVESKEQALAVAASEKLLAAYYDGVIQDLERETGSAARSVFDDERIEISLYLKEGFALSRRLAIRYQLCLQEAGVLSLVVEGKLKLFGTKMRHAWNLAWFDRHVALVDVTLPAIGRPLILLGASPEEAYREAMWCDRLYLPPPDSLDSPTLAVGKRAVSPERLRSGRLQAAAH